MDTLLSGDPPRVDLAVSSVSSETVGQHRHTYEEGTGPHGAATEATYFLSGTHFTVVSTILSLGH